MSSENKRAIRRQSQTVAVSRSRRCSSGVQHYAARQAEPWRPINNDYNNSDGRAVSQGPRRVRRTGWLTTLPGADQTHNWFRLRSCHQHQQMTAIPQHNRSSTLAYGDRLYTTVRNGVPQLVNSEDTKTVGTGSAAGMSVTSSASIQCNLCRREVNRKADIRTVDNYQNILSKYTYDQ